jgi:hypothetical protein
MTKSLTTQTFGVPSDGVPELIETSDKVARLSQAGHAYEARLRELEHQFESKACELGEEYVAIVLQIHESPEWPEAATAKRKSRIIPYPQTIDPADRAIFDEFKAEILGIANRNQARMGGTPGQLKQIIDGAELVFAVWNRDARFERRAPFERMLCIGRFRYRTLETPRGRDLLSFNQRT